MTASERIKYLRKEILGISQADFAARLGMKQTGVSYMERNDSGVTEQTIKMLSLLYGINDEWLRNGTGEIFCKSKKENFNDDNFDIDAFVKSKGGSELEAEILKIYFELPPRLRRETLDFFKKKMKGEAPIPDTCEELEMQCPPISDSDDNKSII